MNKKRGPKNRFKRPQQSHREAAWDLRFAELKEYRRLHGHCYVPSCFKEHLSLGYWVSHQRILYRKGRLNEVRKKRLEKIAFDWVARGRSAALRDSRHWDANWDRMLGKLVEFYRQFGHCRVAKVWQGTHTLNTWVKRQMLLEQQGRLSPYRRRKLSALGLKWKDKDGIDPRWNESFLKLRAFYQRFYHAHVPAEWAEDLRLGKWVVKMRRMRRSGRLSEEKARRLDELGFVWDASGKRQAEHDRVWTKWLARLTKFYQQKGHWSVPTDQPEFHQLRVWSDNQRISYQRGWLPEKRIRALEAVNFPWVSNRVRRTNTAARGAHC